MRVAADLEALSAPPYSEPGPGITRYAFTAPFARTLEYFASAFGELGYTVGFDPVGTLVAANRGPGEPCFGVGSHCDSIVHGGRYDGTMGVVCALEVCRLARDRGLDLPLRVFAFVEEEGSGFGQAMLGSRIMTGVVTADDLAGFVNREGEPFLAAAARAGHPSERWEESGRALDGLDGWIEMHIEQGRVLADAGERLGIVDAIAGLVRVDVAFEGRADHSGATPMPYRSDAGLTAAEVVVELDRLTRTLSEDAVGTAGEVRVEPDLINTVPGRATLGLDLRSASGDHVVVHDRLEAYARERAAGRGQPMTWSERQRVEPTPMDPGIVAALAAAADATGAGWRRMPSGAAHDTMYLARRVPSAMVFVPCVEGISHSPAESADPADAALAAEVILSVIERLHA
jgi:hydantoinase/carbamoylase family amidase